MTNQLPETASPKWGSTAKIIFGLTLAGIVTAALIYFRSLIGPLLLAGIIAYLLHPVAARICAFTRLPWRPVVTVLYILLLVAVIGILTLSGLAVVNQVQNLIGTIKTFVQNDLPRIANDLSQQEYSIGPFEIDLSRFNLNNIAQQAINTVEPMLGRLGVLVGTLATQVITVVGMILFVLLISYFVLADVGRVPKTIDYIKIPGYDDDIRHLGAHLGRIWNAFLRGQLIIITMTVVVYTILMWVLGVRNWAFIIAVLAGLARLVPYLGPTVTWTVVIIVTSVQGTNYFGLDQIVYTILVLGLALFVDQIFDNIISPVVMGSALQVHPALLLIGALLAAKLLGLIGLLLAAPVIASIKLLGGYLLNKMLDLDPWQAMPLATDLVPSPLVTKTTGWLRQGWQGLRRTGKKDRAA